MKDLKFDKNYMVFGMKIARITQTYKGTYSHSDNSGLPTDLGGKDTGKDDFYCPSDKVTVKRVYTSSNGMIVVWYEAENVYTPMGFLKKATFSITHMDKEDIDSLGIKVGKVFYRGQVIGREGKSGTKDNHIHIECSNYAYTGNGWIQDKLKRWGIYKPIKIEQMFYMVSGYTQVVDTKGIRFKWVAELKEIGLYYKTDDKNPVKYIPLKKYKVEKTYTAKDKTIWYHLKDGKVIGWVKKVDYDRC